MKWYIEVLKKYAVAAGRARRKEYWMFALVNTCISLVLGMILGFIEGMFGLGDKLSSTVGLIYTLGTLVPSLAVGIRRMHDTGHSGWWIIVPVANLIFACIEGEPRDNQYGPNPKTQAVSA